jgi:hypothetical protein
MRAGKICRKRYHTPDRCAIELFELPNDIPMAYCSTPSVGVAPSTSSFILKVLHGFAGVLKWSPHYEKVGALLADVFVASELQKYFCPWINWEGEPAAFQT